MCRDSEVLFKTTNVWSSQWEPVNALPLKTLSAKLPHHSNRNAISIIIKLLRLEKQRDYCCHVLNEE